MRLARLSAFGVVAAACGSFSEAGTAPTPEAGAVDHDASDAASDGGGPAGDGGDVSDAGACDRDCLLFADDFERPSNLVQGPWSAAEEGVTLFNTGDPARGIAMRAALAHGENRTFRYRGLLKELTPRTGVRVQAKIRLVQLPDAGAFGPDALDYCEVLTFLLGGRRVAMFYVDASGVLEAYLYGPREMGGTYVASSAPVTEWTDVELAVAWTTTPEATVTLGARVGGVALAQQVRPLDLDVADLDPGVRAGIRCHGTTPSLRVDTDDVSVTSIP